MRCADLVSCLLSVELLLWVEVGGAPQIIVIMADDMGWNDVSFHGSSQIMTPNIDALAYQGVVLNRHYTQPTCSPSRAAFLSGLYPIHTGLHRPISAGTANALTLNHTLLPQYLSKLGYHSHLVGKWHLGSHRSEYLPTQRGFDSHFGYWNGYLGYFDGIHLDSGVAGIDARRNKSEAWQEFVGNYATDLFTQEAVSIVKKHDSAKGPLFLQVALSAPHTGNKGSELEVRDLAENEKQHAHIADPNRRLYAGMVRGVDDSVGAILESLRSRDMLNDSIVLFTSDNGAPTIDPLWSYNNHGSNWPLRGMKLSCHEGGVRTAAVLWSPLVVGSRVSQDLIHISDWMPTLYSAAGGDVKDLGLVDGVNQWDSLRGYQAGPRTEMLIDLDPVFGNQALINWPWKLVRYSSDNPTVDTFAGESGRGSEVPEYSVTQVSASLVARALSMTRTQAELLSLRAKASLNNRCTQNESYVLPCDNHFCLFNLDTDPSECLDLSTSQPSMVTSLEQALARYRLSTVPVQAHNKLDPRAHPSLWHWYWATWADQSSGQQIQAPLVPVLGAAVVLGVFIL